MSEKKLHLFVVGEGDSELQSLIERGLSEIGHTCATTSIDASADAGVVLDALRGDEIPVVIKPL